jgi:hypothetical protein
MHKFAKGLIKNVSLIALTIGMIGGFISYDDLKEQRAANKDAIKVEVENAGSSELVGKYVEIHGGVANFLETYEYGIGGPGEAEEMLTSEFYYPIVLTLGGLPQYIVVADSPPDLSAEDPSRRTGLLKAHSDLPEKVADAYAAQYPDTSFAVLDTQFTPAPIARKYINFVAFLLLIIASFFAFRWSIQEPSKPEDEA